MDYQMLKELKKKMDNDTESAKKKSSQSSLHDILIKGYKGTPKTFSPEHKPIHKINQNPEFFKSNINTISSKLNFVNFNNFFELKENLNKTKNKLKDDYQRQRFMSYHKKPMITESLNNNISKKIEISKFKKSEDDPLHIVEKNEGKINILLNTEETNRSTKKILHKKTASYGCNPFSFFDMKNMIGTEEKFNEKPNSFYDNIFKAKPFQKTLSIRYVTKTKKGFQKKHVEKCNQDTFISVPNLGKNIHHHLFAICDGHGTYGHLVSNFLKEHLPKCLLADPNFSSDPQKSIHKAIEHIEQVLENSFIDTNFSGSTLIAILILNNSIISANVGDSRAILAKKDDNNWNFINLSFDHKPEVSFERERIIKQGGRIDYILSSEGQPMGPLRVWLSNENNCGIAMTRSIGDKTAKSVGVTWEPDIRAFNIEDDDKFIVVGSDGLWEVIGNQECVEIIGEFYEKQDLEGAGEFLMAETSRRWMEIEQNAIDDITFIIVFFAQL